MPNRWTARYHRYKSAPRTWDPGAGGKKPPICWEDHLTWTLGEDPDGLRFVEISDRMLTGHYYPRDVIESFGLWTDEGREIRAGDRILQCARLLPFSAWPALWAMTEVFVAARTTESCYLGYVTTQRHFGRGIWRANLIRARDGLTLEVISTSGPQSWLFWIGLPIARFLQKRAWRRAAQEFNKI